MTLDVILAVVVLGGLLLVEALRERKRERERLRAIRVRLLLRSSARMAEEIGQTLVPAFRAYAATAAEAAFAMREFSVALRNGFAIAEPKADGSILKNPTA